LIVLGLGFDKDGEGDGIGEIEMSAVPEHKPHGKDIAREKRERRHGEDALDEALKDTFPASDPASAEQPKPIDADSCH
jgi:hypothetical protein